EQALRASATYIGFVASRTKAQKVFEYLRGKGIPAQKLDQVRAPAGLNLGARSPEEIAVSILAEMVQLKAAQGRVRDSAGALPTIEQTVKDPICGMTVDSAKAKYKSNYAGADFYFCCAGCKQTFDQQPEKYTHAA